MVTVWPSLTVWSGPAWTVGGLLALSVTVTWRVSMAVAVPSLTVRVMVMVVLEATLGAAKAVEGELGSSKVMARAPSWNHP